MNTFDRPPVVAPNRQRRQALLVLMLGLLVAAAAIYVAVQDSSSAAATPPTALISGASGFPVASMQGIDNSGTRPDAGHVAPNFAFYLADGSTATLADYRGRPVVVNFWASWCDPCRREMPDLVRLYEVHKDEGLVVLEVNVSESEEAVAAFVQELGMTMPVIMDARSEVLDAYKSQSLPTSIFIDRQGMIQVRWLGFLTPDLMEAHVRKIL